MHSGGMHLGHTAQTGINFIWMERYAVYPFRAEDTAGIFLHDILLTAGLQVIREWIKTPGAGGKGKEEEG